MQLMGAALFFEVFTTGGFGLHFLNRLNDVSFDVFFV